ncbi:Muscle M-line assembly protein unc-89 Uncoordinated protein 89 [Salmonella enterica]|nr:Muscle M-line assembly protein unc-89 Uncoordinated protein 89 [Salmonella enterica]
MRRPTLNGRGEAGATINVYLDGNSASIGTTTVNSDGTWSFTPQTPLANGSHTFTLSATDPAGNSSAVSSGFVLTIDAHTARRAGYRQRGRQYGAR